MKRLLILLIVGIVSLLSFNSGVSSPVRGKSDPTEIIHWRMWQLLPFIPTAPPYDRWRYPPWDYQQAATKIMEESSGKLNIRVSTPSELGLRGPELLRALKDGLIEIAEVPLAYLSAEVPWVSIADLPYIVQDAWEEQPKLLEILGPEFEKLATEYDCTMLVMVREYVCPTTAFYTKRPIKGVEDLKGLKLRIMSPYHKGVLEKAGAVPIFMPWADVHMAAKTGVIDGFITSMALWLAKANEMGLKYETPAWPYPITVAIVVSNKALSKLSPELKDLVLDVWGRWFKNLRDAATYNIRFWKEQVELDKSQGMQIIPKNPDLWRTLEAYARETDWVAYEKKSGTKGTELLKQVLQALGRQR